MDFEKFQCRCCSYGLRNGHTWPREGHGAKGAGQGAGWGRGSSVLFLDFGDNFESVSVNSPSLLFVLGSILTFVLTLVFMDFEK